MCRTCGPGLCHGSDSPGPQFNQLPITKWPHQSEAPVGAAPPTRSQLRLQQQTQTHATLKTAATSPPLSHLSSKFTCRHSSDNRRTRTCVLSRLGLTTAPNSALVSWEQVTQFQSRSQLDHSTCPNLPPIQLQCMNLLQTYGGPRHAIPVLEALSLGS
jgi:hypothetical protein